MQRPCAQRCTWPLQKEESSASGSQPVLRSQGSNPAKWAQTLGASNLKRAFGRLKQATIPGFGPRTMNICDLNLQELTAFLAHSRSLGGWWITGVRLLPGSSCFRCLSLDDCFLVVVLCHGVLILVCAIVVELLRRFAEMTIPRKKCADKCRNPGS